MVEMLYMRSMPGFLFGIHDDEENHPKFTSIELPRTYKATATGQIYPDRSFTV